MKTKKITLLISILFTFVFFSVPAFAWTNGEYTMWWDISVTDSNGTDLIFADMLPDTNVTLTDGDTLKANLYISGLDEEHGLTWVEGDITYAKPGMFNVLTVDDTHLHSDFENIRGESIGYTTSGDRLIYQEGGYILGEVLYGDDAPVFGEFDVYYPGSGVNWAGLQLTANDTIDPFANITINIDDFASYLLDDSGVPSLPNNIINLTINAVPVPAAIWLIGSAMLCMLGINQRKKK